MAGSITRTIPASGPPMLKGEAEGRQQRREQRRGHRDERSFGESQDRHLAGDRATGASIAVSAGAGQTIKSAVSAMA